MLCEKCKINPANVHTIQVINGAKVEHHLCTECAGGMQLCMPTMMEILAGFPREPRVEETCACGAGFTRFQQTGLLGCPDCYKTFQAALLRVIKRAQGGRTLHVGRRYGTQGQAEAGAGGHAAHRGGAADERAQLRMELERAVSEERYERAAELRDRLRALEGGEGA